MSDMIHS